jgi:hypothetical protein
MDLLFARTVKSKPVPLPPCRHQGVVIILPLFIIGLDTGWRVNGKRHTPAALYRENRPLVPM